MKFWNIVLRRGVVLRYGEVLRCGVLLRFGVVLTHDVVLVFGFWIPWDVLGKTKGVWDIV